MLKHTTELLMTVLAVPEERLNLAEAALLLAKDEYPTLDVADYLHRLERLAEGVRARLTANAGLEDKIVALNEFLFDDQGFSGNLDDYYDPRNNFLNDVLDRKLGIPITLSILYMEVGSRIGLVFEGISFPGHFLVKLPTDDGDVLLDPFSGGMPISAEDVLARIKQRFPEDDVRSAALDRLLVAANKKEILVRILRNLKAIYIKTGDDNKALLAMNRILLVQPDSPEEIRERAELYDRLECFRPALADYRHYVKLNPEAPEALDLHRRIVELERLAARLN